MSHTKPDVEGQRRIRRALRQRQQEDRRRERERERERTARTANDPIANMKWGN